MSRLSERRSLVDRNLRRRLGFSQTRRSDDVRVGGRVERGRLVVRRAKAGVLVAQDESDIGVFGRTIDTIGFEIHAFVQ
jgi:hypothetical protein